MAFDRDTTPGDIYQSESGDLYRVIGYQQNPTVIIERIANKDASKVSCLQSGRLTHAVGCLNAEQFTKIGTFTKYKGE